MLKLAIPNKGRLCDRTVRLLEEAGFGFDRPERRLSARAEHFPLEILFTRADDIPVYLARGIVDLGITGQDLADEHGGGGTPLLPLGYGRCRLVLAAPAGQYRSAGELPRPCRIATSFPNIAGRFFAAREHPVEIADIRGAVEVSPRLGLADAIVDLTSSGETLTRNDLEILDLVLESEAALFASAGALAAREPEIRLFAEALRSVLAAHRKKYIMANLPADRAESVASVLPAITAPTILHLAGCPDKVAVHSVIGEEEVNAVVARLREIGAEGILVLPIERLFA